MIPVGVGAEALEVHDLSPHGDLLAEHFHRLGSVQQVAAQSPRGLEAHKHHGALRPPQIVLQVVADTARVAHTRGGDDNLGGGVQIQVLDSSTVSVRCRPGKLNIWVPSFTRARASSSR